MSGQGDPNFCFLLCRPRWQCRRRESLRGLPVKYCVSGQGDPKFYIFCGSRNGTTVDVDVRGLQGLELTGQPNILRRAAEERTLQTDGQVQTRHFGTCPVSCLMSQGTRREFPNVVQRAFEKSLDQC